MKFSLLQKAEDSPAVCEILYDLSVDRAVYNLVSDKRRADFFLATLSKPLTNPENIYFRQQIYTDFKTIPGLFEALQLLFTRYDRIKSDWQEMKLGTAPGRGAEINPEALLEYTFSSLKVTAIFPSTITSFFTSIGETLSAYPITSEGLLSIRDWCISMADNAALDELVNISQLFRYQTPEHFDFTTAVRMDSALRLVGCDISGIAEHKQEGGAFSKLFTRKKADDGFQEIAAELSKAGEDPYSDSVFMLNEALSRIDAALTQITNDVYEASFGMSNGSFFMHSESCFSSANSSSCD